MYSIAVLGDRDSIYGFASLGLDVYPVENRDEALERLRSLDGGNYAVVYVTEWLAEELEAELSRYAEHKSLAVIPIPGVRGNTGIGIRRVKEAVEKAVGSDIIFNNQA